MSWATITRQYKDYLKLERSLAENSIDAYLSDVAKLEQFFEIKNKDLTPIKVMQQDLLDFITFINELGMSRYSQATIDAAVIERQQQLWQRC